jgi:hypothetical protein
VSTADRWEHKDKLTEHLLARYQSWFGVRFEFLLYDVTSTFFEGRAELNKLALHGPIGLSQLDPLRSRSRTPLLAGIA